MRKKRKLRMDAHRGAANLVASAAWGTLMRQRMAWAVLKTRAFYESLDVVMGDVLEPTEAIKTQ